MTVTRTLPSFPGRTFRPGPGLSAYARLPELGQGAPARERRPWNPVYRINGIIAETFNFSATGGSAQGGQLPTPDVSGAAALCRETNRRHSRATRCGWNRESSPSDHLDSRFRGNDRAEG